MNKKGKFKLLSYVIKENLLIYKSLNRVNKYIAFSILEANNIQPIIKILNELLSNQMLKEYSIQIDACDKNQISIILNFENNQIEQIKNNCDSIFRVLQGENEDYSILVGGDLENKFLSVLFKNLTLTNKVIKEGGDLLVENGQEILCVDVFKIVLYYPQIQASFVSTFIELIINLNQKGYLIINFQKNPKGIILFSFHYVNLRTKEQSIRVFQEEVYKFYNYDILEKIDLNMKDIFRLIRRTNLSNLFYQIDILDNLFSLGNQYDFSDIATFNFNFEKRLLENENNYVRFNENLVLVENKYLFYCSDKLDLETVSKILEKYYHTDEKYILYFILLKNNNYKEMIQLEDIKPLKRLKILNSKEFTDLDLRSLKN